MTEKELRRMSRRELLELLLFQMEENEKLRKELNEANTLLKDREIMISESGSIAEAAMKVNGVFLAAEKAALQYLENVRRLEAESRKRAAMNQMDVDNKGNE